MSTAINVEEHIGLVKSIAKKYNGIDYCEYDDLVQVGCVALCRAANSFDESKGFKFSTLAGNYIENQIKTYLRDFIHRRVSAPRSIIIMSRKISQTEKKLGENSSIENICKELGINESQYNNCVDYMLSQQTYSLEYTYDNDGDTSSFQELVSDNSLFESKIIENEVILNYMEYLSEKQKKIVYLTYWEELSQTKIGEILGITQVQVSRELRRALNTMKDVVA